MSDTRLFIPPPSSTDGCCEACVYGLVKKPLDSRTQTGPVIREHQPWCPQRNQGMTPEYDRLLDENIRRHAKP